MRFHLQTGSRRKHVASCVLAASLMMLSGCAGVSPLAKPADLFSKATASVVTRSENAYQAANRLYLDEQVSQAVLNYDSSPTWDPRKLQPLLTPQQLGVRKDLLDALKAYAEDVDTIANTKASSKALDTNSTAIGHNLVTLSDNLATDTGRASLKFPQSQANYLSTAVNALGQFLIDQQIRKELAPKIVAMDTPIVKICYTLQLDIGTLQAQAKYDYSQLLTQQDLFIRSNGDQLSPTEKRNEVHRLAVLYEKSQAADKILGGLKDSIGKLADTHHALAQTAAGADPATFNARLTDLLSSAQALETYYSSLPTD